MDEIVRVRQLAQFVEIVDAPDQTPLGVPPGAEVLDVQIADGETARRIGEGAAEQRPALNPPVEGGAQEHERTRAHPLVFLPQIGSDDRGPGRQPGLVLPGRRDEISG